MFLYKLLFLTSVVSMSFQSCRTSEVEKSNVKDGTVSASTVSSNIGITDVKINARMLFSTLYFAANPDPTESPVTPSRQKEAILALTKTLEGYGQAANSAESLANKFASDVRAAVTDVASISKQDLIVNEFVTTVAKATAYSYATESICKGDLANYSKLQERFGATVKIIPQWWGTSCRYVVTFSSDRNMQLFFTLAAGNGRDPLEREVPKNENGKAVVYIIKVVALSNQAGAECDSTHKAFQCPLEKASFENYFKNLSISDQFVALGAAADGKPLQGFDFGDSIDGTCSARMQFKNIYEYLDYLEDQSTLGKFASYIKIDSSRRCGVKYVDAFTVYDYVGRGSVSN